MAVLARRKDDDPSGTEMLYSKNPNLPINPASVYKVLFATLIDDLIQLEKVSYSTKLMAGKDLGRGSLIKGGEVMNLRDLMALAILRSDRAACKLLARQLSERVYGLPAEKGDEHFLELMNLGANALGMRDTYVEDIAGSTGSKTQRSTALDMIKLGFFVAEFHPDLFKIMALPETAITNHSAHDAEAATRTIKHRSKLVSMKRPGLIASKTGTMRFRSELSIWRHEDFIYAAFVSDTSDRPRIIWRDGLKLIRTVEKNFGPCEPIVEPAIGA